MAMAAALSRVRATELLLNAKVTLPLRILWDALNFYTFLTKVRKSILKLDFQTAPAFCMKVEFNS